MVVDSASICPDPQAIVKTWNEVGSLCRRAIHTTVARSETKAAKVSFANIV